MFYDQKYYNSKVSTTKNSTPRHMRAESNFQACMKNYLSKNEVHDLKNVNKEFEKNGFRGESESTDIPDNYKVHYYSNFLRNYKIFIYI